MSDYRVITVKEFNKLATERYYKAIEAWRHSEDRAFPFMGLYLFWNSGKAEPIQKGFVATNDKNIHCFGESKQIAIKKFEERI